MEELKLPRLTVVIGRYKGDADSPEERSRQDHPIIAVSFGEHSQEAMLQWELGNDHDPKRLQEVRTFHLQRLGETPVASSIAGALCHHDVAAAGVACNSEGGKPLVPPSYHFLSAVLKQILVGIYKQGGFNELIKVVGRGS